jgi:hypothetical protein
MIIQILLCHIGDFKSHPGWWALFPGDILPKVNEYIIFRLGESEEIAARVTRLILAGDKERKEEQNDFIGWNIIEYVA